MKRDYSTFLAIEGEEADEGETIGRWLGLAGLIGGRRCSSGFSAIVAGDGAGEAELFAGAGRTSGRLRTNS